MSIFTSHTEEWTTEMGITWEEGKQPQKERQSTGDEFHPCTDNPDLNRWEHNILIRELLECPYCGQKEE